MLRVIVAFGRERYEYHRFREQGETRSTRACKLTVRQTLFSLVVTTITALGTALVLGFGAYHVLEGKLTSASCSSLIAYIAAVYQPLEQISTTVGHAARAASSASTRRFELLDTEPEVDRGPGRGRRSSRARGRRRRSRTSSFAYQGRSGHAARRLASTVEPGQRVAIVGPTGAGKSTLVSLLVALLRPAATGAILLDGVDMRDAARSQSLRDQISVVLQEPLLFSGTIAENIRYGRLDATEEEVVEAARAANAHDFIERLPQGYDTELGERGAQLSGGERQRICVARAFLKDAPILILDEPTSSIDSRTEAVILDALDRLMDGRTSFMIAHRLSTVRHADLILVVDQGRVVEQGTHEELLARGGLYRQLHDVQTRRRQLPSRATCDGAGVRSALEKRGDASVTRRRRSSCSG